MSLIEQKLIIPTLKKLYPHFNFINRKPYYNLRSHKSNNIYYYYKKSLDNQKILVIECNQHYCEFVSKQTKLLFLHYLFDNNSCCSCLQSNLTLMQCTECGVRLCEKCVLSQIHYNKIVCVVCLQNWTNLDGTTLNFS